MTAPGLRLQILLLLGGLLLVTFVPLHFAVATYTEVALRQQREEHVRLLGRSIAARISEQRALRSAGELRQMLANEVAAGGVEALGVFDPSGTALARVGDVDLVAELGRLGEQPRGDLFELTGSRGPALAVREQTSLGSVVAVLRVDRATTRTAPLISLIGLYMGLIALALLLLAYLALTRFIVRPLDRLAQAAQRVAGGARQFDAPSASARELSDLAHSVKQMTERLLAEEQALREKIDEVERATQELQQTQSHLVRSERLASVGRLAAGLAHEVGNPIAAILGMQDLLLQGGLSAGEQRDFLTRMQRETERINNIVRNLLQFARPGSGPAQTVSTQPGDVATALEDTVELLTPQKALAEIELSVEVPDGLPAVLLGREQLVQVFLNLLLNAADACAASSGGSKNIRVRVSLNQTDVIVEVEDTGPGVAADVIDRLFEPFVTTKEIGHGTGLGLAVCRGLVEAVNGTITLDPEYDQGARFRVTLPVARASLV